MGQDDKIVAIALVSPSNMGISCRIWELVVEPISIRRCIRSCRVDLHESFADIFFFLEYYYALFVEGDENKINIRVNIFRSFVRPLRYSMIFGSRLESYGRSIINNLVNYEMKVAIISFGILSFDERDRIDVKKRKGGRGRR